MTVPDATRTRPRPRSATIAGIVIAAITLCVWVGTARAHIVPAEEYHPVTEAYLRGLFFLNLKPIPWKEMRQACSVVVGELRSSGSADPDAQQTIQLIRKALADVARPQRDEEEYAPKTYRGDCFTGMTHGVAWLVRNALENAERHLSDPSLASKELAEARQIYRSFEDAIRACDPEAYERLGEAWLECRNAIGYPGLGGIGAMAPDPALMRRSLATLSDYLERCYGRPQFTPVGYRFEPIPQASPSCRPGARPPLRLPPGAEVNKQNPRPRQILNMAARGVSETETYLVAVGDMAFDSSFIFGEPARSLGVTCNQCHNKGTTNAKFFIPGLSHQRNAVDVSNIFFNPRFNNALFDPLDIPDMRGLRFTAPYGRNGRFASLREFTRNVIVNEFNGTEPDPEILDGLVAYQFEFDFLPNTYLNRSGSLNATASAAAKRGERLFQTPFPQMGGKSCASCHIPSSHFVDRRAHDIGSGRPAEQGAIDTAFDTPTLINVRYSAPYFHDGSLPTLKAVNEWFNRRYRLGLTRAQLADLTAYVETVGEGVQPTEKPGSIVAPEMEEFSFFLSALEHAIPERKRAVVETTGRTVSFEIRAHKWDLRNPELGPVMDRLASLADAIADAAVAGNWDGAMQSYREYVQVYRKHEKELE